MAQRQISDAFASAVAQDAGPPVGQLIMRRKWLILFGILLGLGLGYLYFTRQPAVFQSYAWIQVTPNQMQLPTKNFRADSSFVGAVETQCDTISSRTVILKAIEDANLAKRTEFRSAEAAYASIMGNLSVEPRSNYSQTIVISYIGSTPSVTRAVVDAVVKAYQDHIGSTDQENSRQVIDLITLARDELLKDLSALEGDLRLLREETPLLSQGDNHINPYAERLIQIETQKTQVLLRRSELQSRIDVIQEAKERGGHRESLSMMISQLKDDNVRSEAATITEKLFPLMLERELLSERLGPDHPDIQVIQRQIAITEAHLNKLLNLNGGPRQPGDIVDIYIKSMEYEIETTRFNENKLQELYTEQELKAETLEKQIARLRELKENIRRKDQVLDEIVKQLEAMNLFNTEGVTTSILTWPVDGMRVAKDLPKYMCVGGALGLIIFSILAYLLESNDKSFRTPEDIRDELGVPVVGHVPVIPSKALLSGSTASPALCTLHAPRGQSSESFRLVRTSLFFGARNGNLRVIQVTSPDQGDGKSTVAANLAVSVAQSGRRTLLIDADMRRPTVHRVFGLSNDTGIADVIGQGVDPQDVIRETETPNLSLILCGPLPENPAELLASNRFDEFLDWARDHYDFVIVDTPPMLAVSDPGNVASRVDGVLLTMRLGKRARAKGLEACEILERVGANMLGVIINGVNARGEYGYQSSYRYTSATPSHYGYGETYYVEEDGTNGKENSVTLRPPHSRVGSSNRTSRTVLDRK